MIRLRLKHLCSRLAILSSFAITLLISGSVQAQTSSEESNVDSIPASNAEKSWDISYGAYIESTLEVEKDFDLNDGNKDDIITNEPEAGITLRLDTSSRYKIYFEAELTRRDFLQNDTDKDDEDWDVTIEETYVDIDIARDDYILRVGRQEFRDDMEWIYDADLDGIRLFSERKTINWEVAAMRENTFINEFLNSQEDEDEDIRNLAVITHFKPKENVNLSAYIISRDEKTFDGSRPEDLLFFGVQSVGKMVPGFKHWLNAAYLTGERERSADTRTIEARAIDIGGTFIADTPKEPSFTLGFAYGSGDAERNQGKDINFRQTGLQDNYYKFNGVTKIKYLGEVFDPEITNISIMTLGFGIRPTKKSSIDIIYHAYNQVEAVDRLTGSNIDRDPEGNSKDLGYEIDVIFGSKEIKDVNIEAVLGIFSPGKAFNSNADRAYFASLEISLGF